MIYEITWPTLPLPGELGYKRRRKKLPNQVDIPDEINSISDFKEFEDAVFAYITKEYGTEPLSFFRPPSIYETPLPKKRRKK